MNLTSDIRLQYAWGRSRPKAAEGARNPKSGASRNPHGGGGERTIWNEAERAGDSSAAEAGWGSRETSSAGSIVSSEEGRDTWSESDGRYREANSDLKGALRATRHVGEVATKTHEDGEASTYRDSTLGNGSTG